MKMVIISDTHKKHSKLIIPKCDLLIHCGDFGGYSYKDTISFLEWFSSFNIKYKILLAGNHEVEVFKIGKEKFKNICKKYNIIYLEDEAITIKGLKFYGTPWSVGKSRYPFMNEEGFVNRKWKEIPLDTEVLLTHSPQHLILDKAINKKDTRIRVHAGSRTLKDRMKQMKKLKFHFFGHIHETRGMHRHIDGYLSINASSYSHFKNKIFKPFVIEFK